MCCEETKMTNLEKYLYQLRRIEEHRELASEKAIRKIYKELLKELNALLGNIYATYSKNDVLTYAELAQAGMDARFLEEVEQRINGISPKVANEINTTVSKTYEACFAGMQEAVTKAAGNRELLKQSLTAISAVTPDVIKRAVENPVSGLTLKDTLEKHRKDIIYDIKRNIGVGLSNGDRFSTMAKRISESLDGDYKKSVRIVRTEAHRVRESGFNDAASDINTALKKGTSGYVMAKTWRTMQDSRVRPNRQKSKKYNHEKMDGVTIPQDELFKLPSGATCMHPSKTGVAGEDINCRCYVSYDLMLASELTGGKKPKKQQEENTQQPKTDYTKTTEATKSNEFIKSIDNCTSTNEVNKVATEYFKAKDCKLNSVDFSGMEIQAAKNSAKKLDDLTSRFNSGLTSVRSSALPQNIGGVCTPTDISLKRSVVSGKYELESDIQINKYLLSSRNIIDKDFKESNRGNKWVNIAQNAQVKEEYADISTLVHEYGHSILAGKACEYLDSNYGIVNKAYNACKRLYRQYTRDIQTKQREINEIRDRFTGQEDGLEKGIKASAKAMKELEDMTISKYSKESVGEFIAEAFCDAELSDKPKEMSLRVYKILEKEYGRGVTND